MEKKLNLCCGSDYKEGFINLDIGERDNHNNKLKIDCAWNITKFPYPFENDTFDLVYCRNALEHFEGEIIIKIIDELYRITKEAGTIFLILPYFTNYVVPRDMTHKTNFTYEWMLNNYYPTHPNIKLETKLILTNNKFFKFINTFVEHRIAIKYFERFLCHIIIPQELHFKIKVKKYEKTM